MILSDLAFQVAEPFTAAWRRSRCWSRLPGPGTGFGDLSAIPKAPVASALNPNTLKKNCVCHAEPPEALDNTAAAQQRNLTKIWLAARNQQQVFQAQMELMDNVRSQHQVRPTTSTLFINPMAQRAKTFRRISEAESRGFAHSNFQARVVPTLSPQRAGPAPGAPWQLAYLHRHSRAVAAMLAADTTYAARCS